VPVVVELDQTAIWADPGQTATSPVRVRNNGDAAAAIRLALTGDAAEWGWLNPSELLVAEGEEAEARLCFNVPRSPQPRAGPVPFCVTATSEDESTAVVTGVLDVQPFRNVVVTLEPRVLEGHEGSFTLNLENRGNAPLSADLEVDATDASAMEVRPATLALDVGGQRGAELLVRSRRSAPWRGGATSISVKAVVDGEVASHASGTLQRPSRRVATAAAIAVALLAGAVVWRLVDTDARRPDTAASRVSPVALSPTMAVGVMRELFVDTTRTTPAQGDQPELAFRTLVTWIYYPASGPPGASLVEDAPPAAAQAPFPLIVFSHGFGLSGRSASDLISHWVAADYVIAAPDYPLTSSNAPGGPMRSMDSMNQPGDARFVLDQVLRLTDDPASRLYRMVDGTRVAAAGYSMGGGITLGIGFNACCRDDRIKAAVVLAGSAPALPGEYFVGPPKPILFVHGDVDGTVPYSGALQRFQDAPPPKLLLTALGGDHGGPYSGDLQEPTAALVVSATLKFFDAHLKADTDALQKLEEEVASQRRVAKLERLDR
jgi:dienelactone hydrolase